MLFQLCSIVASTKSVLRVPVEELHVSQKNVRRYSLTDPLYELLAVIPNDFLNQLHDGQ